MKWFALCLLLVILTVPCFAGDDICYEVSKETGTKWKCEGCVCKTVKQLPKPKEQFKEEDYQYVETPAHTVYKCKGVGTKDLKCVPAEPGATGRPMNEVLYKKPSQEIVYYDDTKPKKDSGINYCSARKKPEYGIMSYAKRGVRQDRNASSSDRDRNPYVQALQTALKTGRGVTEAARGLQAYSNYIGAETSTSPKVEAAWRNLQSYMGSGHSAAGAQIANETYANALKEAGVENNSANVDSSNTNNSFRKNDTIKTIQTPQSFDQDFTGFKFIDGVPLLGVAGGAINTNTNKFCHRSGNMYFCD
ncbi:MAG: hypothetical protein H7844_09955 [Nitrospirae bacterium YQR-1]